MTISSHAKRWVTSLILLPVLAAALTLGGWYLFSLLLLISLLGLWEFYSLFWPETLKGLGKKAGGCLSAIVFLLAAKQEDPHLVIAAMVLAFWAGNLFFLYCYSRRPSESFYTNAAVLVVGLLYLPFVLQFPLFFRPAESVLVLLAAIATDVGGYYAGSYLGGPKIWPQISPKKTWAGAAGGMALCALVCLCHGLAFGSAPWSAFLLLGVTLNLAAQFGDFFESALKRWLGVKDSGNILPGHGGILDRIDSLLLVIPVYAGARALYQFYP